MFKKVELARYNPDWAAEFKREAELVRKALGENVLDISHVGSTAIPGIVAKPIIDLLVVVARLSRVEACYPEMISLGYTPKGEYGIPGRRFFMKFQGEARTHNVHTFEAGHEDIERLINLRDYLIAHPDEARAYGALKMTLANRFADDLDSYTHGKSEFIQEIYRKARIWRAGQEP